MKLYFHFTSLLSPLVPSKRKHPHSAMERFTVAVGTTIMNGRSHTTIFAPPPISFPIKQTIHRNPTQMHPPVTGGDTTELSIFSADRYFNEVVTNKNNQNTNLTTPKRFVSFEMPVMAERSDLSYTRDSSVSSSVDVYGGNCREDRFHVAPTASSEASWNSQSGLLRNAPATAAVASKALSSSPSTSSSSEQRRRPLPSSWLFRRSCPCSNKRSVEVKERIAETKSPKQLFDFDSADDGSSLDLRKQNVIEDGSTKSVSGSVPKLKVKSSIGDLEKEREAFTFQSSNLYSPETTNPCPSRIGHKIFNSGGPFTTDTGNFSFPVLNKPSTLYDPPRDSLEVFCPKDDNTADAAISQHRKLTKPKTTRRSFTFQGNPNVGRVLDDDVASDSSSDLFEIESFSTTMTSGPIYRRRDSLDEILAMDPRHLLDNAAGVLHLRQGMEESPRPSNAPSECYPPSEVSIQWSVITAEGFDKSSVANFSSAASDYEEMSAFPVLPEKDVGGKKRGGLLSCRSEKAVSVGPNPMRYLPEQKKVGVAKNGGFLSTAAGRAIGNSGVGKERPPPLLAKSHSARMTRPIQTR